MSKIVSNLSLRNRGVWAKGPGSAMKSNEATNCEKYNLHVYAAHVQCIYDCRCAACAFMNDHMM